MTFRVVQMLHAIGPGEGPHSSTTKRAGIADHADALEQARVLAEQFPFHGYDAEQGQWWGREQEHGGVNRLFFVQGEP